MFDMCQDCYAAGKTCEDSGHRLTLYLAYGESKGWQAIYSQSSVYCDRCSQHIGDAICYRGYHTALLRLTRGLIRVPADCDKCNDGKFDVCPSCYMSGFGCLDKEHHLTKMLLR